MPDIRRPEIACADGDRVFVSESGTFAGGPYSCEGRLPPGQYAVEIGAPSVDLQPAELRSVLGPGYANFTGRPMKDTEFGRTIEFATTAVVGGPRSLAAERELRSQKIKQIRARARADCTDRPAQLEKLTGKPVLNPDDVVKRCIDNANTMSLETEQTPNSEAGAA